MSYRISIDIGGTFTDLVIVDDGGDIALFKTPTTHEKYADAVIKNLESGSNSLDISLKELMKGCSTFIGGSLVHGSTISTNALIENKVAKTGLICTRGFRDMLLDREGGKAEPFNWNIDYPAPYIPRYLTLPVTERMNAEGDVETPLNEDDVRDAIKQFKKCNVEAIAVSLIWSIANPKYELRIGEIIEEEWPGIPYVLSHQINPIIREYRRTSSAAINASLIPIIEKYVSSFKERLRDIGYTGEMLMLTSSGGVMSAEELTEKPIFSIDCGPSLAPTAGLWFAERETGKRDVITVDMGGTSFDVSCVSNGEIAVSREAWIGDHMLGFSKVDSTSIGAGGGSIIWIDSGGLLHVGPQSAGSNPGPACYGQGGNEPTITDTNVILGYIDPDYFLGGSMKLKADLARKSMQKIADRLNLGLEEAAFTAWSTVNVNMITAIEDITVWQGIDPREYLFVSGGGAAGLHIIPIVRELGAKEILIPKTASVISAMGGVFANITSEFSASLFADSRNFDYEKINTILADLEVQAENFLNRAGVPSEMRRIEFHVEARYPYQVWEISVPLRSNRISDESDLHQLIGDFHDVHERIFGIKEEGQSIECIYWRAKAIGITSKPKLREVPVDSEDPSAALKGTRQAYFRERGGMVKTNIYEGDLLQEGNLIEAPAVIEEPTMTIVVFPGSQVRITELGSYLISSIS
jgi:N-methylhydantoinase A